MKKWSMKILLSFVIVLAFFLRFYRVTEIPPSLNWDEVSIGYNAYSILKTGKDEWGRTLPVHFQSYGEYKLPVQIYASIPGIAIFGLNELGVRITPVVYGTLTVLVLFFLARELSGKDSIGLISSFLLATSVWHIHLTRASFESSFSVFWIVLGIWFAVKGFRAKKFWLFSTIPFALAIYTYNSARVFTPLFLLVMFWIYRKEILKHKKVLYKSVFIFVIFMLPLAAFWLGGEATARLKLVSITDDPGFVLRINKARGQTNLPAPLPQLIHNKVTHFTYVFTANYLSHFTPNYLFISGAPHKQHHVQMIGQLYAFQAPFLIAGIFYLFKWREKFRWILVSWVLLAFVPVSITIDSIPHALRTLIAAPAYQIITAYGIYWTCLVVRRKDLKLAFILVALIMLSWTWQFRGYLDNYYNIYPKLYSRDWQYGNKQVVEFIKKHFVEYDLIVFTRHYGEPHMFTLFYFGWDPAKFQNDPNLNRFETYDWVRVLNFDKFYFPDLGDTGTTFLDIVRDNGDKKILFVGKPGDFPSETPRLLTVDFLNGDGAFEVVEVK